MSDKTIMIVDDDLHLILSLTPRLEANGYKVISAMNTSAAIVMAQKNSPDLVILDLRLPAESDGLMLLQQMRGATEFMKTPIIVLTAGDAASYKKRVLDAGATAFFQKPPDNDQLLGAIRKALGGTRRHLASV
jgi:two-component system, chemotaxis family, sensor kinase CheA